MFCAHIIAAPTLPENTCLFSEYILILVRFSHISLGYSKMAEGNISQIARRMAKISKVSAFLGLRCIIGS